MTRRLRLAPLLLLAALTAPPASVSHAATGEVLDGTPAAVVQVFKQVSSLASSKVTFEPATTMALATIRIVILGKETVFFLEGCKDGTCKWLRASNSHYLGTVDPEMIDFVREWNAKHYTQAYWSGDRLYLDAGYVLTGGFTQENLLLWIQKYLTDAEAFEDEYPV